MRGTGVEACRQDEFFVKFLRAPAPSLERKRIRGCPSRSILNGAEELT